MYKFEVSTVPADGVESLGVRASTGTVVTKFVSYIKEVIYIYEPEFEEESMERLIVFLHSYYNSVEDMLAIPTALQNDIDFK